MLSKQFVKAAVRTESIEFHHGAIEPRVLHAIMGLVTEFDELTEALAKGDTVNALEELGDLYWYLAIMQSAGVFKVSNGYFPTDRRLGSLVTELQTRTISMLDAAKKTLFYGKELPMEDIDKCAQQVLFLVNEIVSKLGRTDEQVQKVVIDKLAARYGNKFTADAAMTRDLNAERCVLAEGYKDA